MRIKDAPAPAHRALVARFTEVCQTDARVDAAFLGGSYARGQADAFSDVDLYVITGDAEFDDFVATSRAFVERLGRLLFLEDFGLPNTLFYIFTDGTEGELGFAPAGDFLRMHRGGYRVLVDKTGILNEATFVGQPPPAAEQLETLRHLVYSFWHDVSHFTTAMARGQLWWAYGQLDALRKMCVDLARLRADFSAPAEGYDKLDSALAPEEIAALDESCCQRERAQMLEAARVLLRFYRERALELCRAHGFGYPDQLERIMARRLNALP
jgi:predicted nucleotidyltransferase